MTSLPHRRNSAAGQRWTAPWRSIALLLALCGSSQAEPYRPASDDIVLATVPRAVQQLKSEREAIAAQPADQDAALRLARTWLGLARRDGDPRFFSYAQATLAPWMERPEARAETRVMMATALQGLHRFPEAQVLLDRTLLAEPQNAQAWLTKAALLQVQGDFSGARSACTPLLRLVDATVALGCIAAAQSMNGHLDPSFRSLSRMVEASPPDDPATHSWLLGVLGEMAVRMNEAQTAERYFRAALEADSANNYAKGEMADLLLREARYDEVMTLLEQDAGQDALLLRLAIAEQRMGKACADPLPSFPRTSSFPGKRESMPSDNPCWAATYHARYRAAQRDNDTLHLREIARYLLDVRGDTTAALDTALLNWKTQREPADIRIYWQASAADAAARTALEDWLARNRYEDALLGLPPEK
jgi:tetratricopeptide (TPR) repeat protein